MALPFYFEDILLRISVAKPMNSHSIKGNPQVWFIYLWYIIYNFN